MGNRPESYRSFIHTRPNHRTPTLVVTVHEVARWPGRVLPDESTARPASPGPSMKRQPPKETSAVRELLETITTTGPCPHKLGSIPRALNYHWMLYSEHTTPNFRDFAKSDRLPAAEGGAGLGTG